MTYRRITILFFLCAIILCFFLWEGYGILGSCLIIFFTTPVWSSVYMNKKRLSREDLKADVISFWTEGFWRILVLAITHFLIMLFIGRKTLIENLMFGYFICAFLGYSYAYFKKKQWAGYWYSFGVFPSVISVFLLINFFFSHSPTRETYSFVTPLRTQINDYDKDAFIMLPRILLKDHAYTDYPGIRSFFDRETIRGNRITYTFEKGLLGFRVVKECEFMTAYK